MNRVVVGGRTLTPEVLALAAAVLDRGGLLIYPTDTLYALGGRASDAAAVRAVRQAKGRDDAKALPVIAADLSQARLLCDDWPATAELLALAFWPGPLSLVLEAAEGLPEGLTAGTGTIAVRVPAHEACRSLVAATGPLISTSANRSGEPAPETCAAAMAGIGESAMLALDGGTGQARPSTLVDLTGPRALLLREGPIAWPAVLEALRSSRP